MFLSFMAMFLRFDEYRFPLFLLTAPLGEKKNSDLKKKHIKAHALFNAITPI